MTEQLMAVESGVITRWVAFISAALVLQVAFLSQFSVMGVHPDLLLLIAISGGLVAGPQRGAGVGFASGLLADLTLHGTLGISALCYTIVGFLVGVVKDALPGTSRTVTALIAFGASVLGVMLYATVTQLLGEHTFSDPKFGTIVAIVAIWNGVLCVPVSSLATRIEGTRAAY